MHKIDVHPDAVLETLLAKNPRSDKAEKLRRLHVICARHNSQVQALRDFTLASIGRLCKSHGLFKTERTLYNAGSEDYCLLINAWAAFSGPTSVKVTGREPKLPPEHQYLLKIDDHALRGIMQSVIAQRDKYKQQLNILKTQTRIEIDQRPRGAVIGDDNATKLFKGLKEKLTNSERDALCHAISQDFLEDRGWQIGSDGEIYSDNGTLLFYPGFATGIKKVLEESQSD
ncbi:MAG: hypothetical protein H6Q76_1345 [Firmicutes bacterium]|nr:hypothetical protein [Bacillota bacterium]